MDSYVPNNPHLQKILLYFHNLKKSTAESHCLLVKAYNEHAFSNSSMYKKRFSKFKEYLFDAEETEYEGRPKKLENENFQALLHEDNTQM